jgi:hypothetical protein
MTTPAERRATVLATVYATFGEPALWTPAGGGDAVSVTVKRADVDDVVQFGDSRAILPSLVLKVRRSDLGSPGQDDTVIVNPGAGQESFVIIAQPRRSPRYGDEWACEARRA